MIIDGKKISSEILEKLKLEVSALPFQPLFCDVLVGDDPVSMSYVRIKGRSAEKIGIQFKLAQIPENTTEVDLVNEIKKLNKLENICGLIVQLPLPKHLNRSEVLDAISPKIDVDSIGSVNTQNFYKGNLDLVPPTAAAVMEMIDSLKVDLTEKNILVVGQGALVGKPVSFLLKNRGLSIKIADEFTKNTEVLLKQADLIVSATGQAGLITGKEIKKGSIIIDAGTSESNGSIVGDVDMASVREVAAYVSPVPGGVGPVTVSQLLKNVVFVAKNIYD